ncbi:MAG TPA: hybrid sensor histidine kinase/response regulator [Verrucomicrobiae bacterium]
MNEGTRDLSSRSMLDLFRAEAETQTAILTAGLIELERGSVSAQTFEVLMRAAHSLKGAARIVNLQPAAEMAHALEDFFAAAGRGGSAPPQADIDLLLSGVDILSQLGKRGEEDLPAWATESAPEIGSFLRQLRARLSLAVRPDSPDATGRAASLFTDQPAGGFHKPEGAAALSSPTTPARLPAQEHALRRAESVERVVRLAPENLNRLLGLAGEALVESRWLRPFSDSLQQLKGHQAELVSQLANLNQALSQEAFSEHSRARCANALRQLGNCQRFLGEKVQELDLFDRRSSHLSQRLYLEVLRTRMRPFSDGVRRFPRMVRDLARSLEKQVKLEISGETTQVDRDILERLETPLAHLLRNAVDHGCETPAQRTQAGKPAEGTVSLEARHSAGMLLVTVEDDGAGVNLEHLRSAIVRKRFATESLAQKFTDSELLEFLFLPGFSLKDNVTELSGRGFGLDIVHNMVRNVRGGIRLGNEPGRGLRIQLQLPLTLSVVRALLVQVAGEPYAIPLGQISRTLTLPRSSLQTLEGRQYFRFADQQIGAVSARQALGAPVLAPEGDLPVVVLGERATRCGLIVDRFLGESELVVQQLDPRLGKVKNISAAAFMEDGAPVLIIDVEDLTHWIETMLAAGRFGTLRRDGLTPSVRPKRILAVDDSLTVREMERQLLAGRGYETDVAADGIEAWNAVRSGIYDLVITDVDMPRMDGIELTNRIKKDPHLGSVPVLLISYKDRNQDRICGLEAGADAYLAKGAFQDRDLIQAVVNLIGEPG